MENKFLIKNLSSLVGQDVTINGWVHNFRSSGKIAFWQIRDGSGFCQAILSSDVLSAEQWALVEKVTQETSVCLQGKVSKHPKKMNMNSRLPVFTIIK